jgi:hypothetical protein
MNTPVQTLELARLRDKGIAAAARDPEVFNELFRLVWGLELLTRRANEQFLHHIVHNAPLAACALLLEPRAFRHRDVWTLFWSLTHASLAIAMQGRAKTHEPELNGAYMEVIRSSIESFEPAKKRGNLAMIIGDHATLGNESRTGADFGLIVEIERKGQKRFLVTLLQAKRATGRFTDVRRAAGESTQIDLLVSSGIGSFLFYHQHDEPAGLGPTTRDADSTASLDLSKVDVVRGATDFAARMAVAAHLLFQHATPFTLPGLGAADGRDDALRLLFNPDIPGIKVNDVLVARIGDTTLPPQAIVAFENEWHQSVSEHRDAVTNVQYQAPKTTGKDRLPPIRFD